MPIKEQYWTNPEKYRKKAKEYQEKHPESHRKANREYNERNKERIKEYRKQYLQRPEVKERRRLKQKERRAKNKLLNSAYHKVARHCELAKKCEFCDSTKNLEAHHFAGYELWYIFVTCCSKCHAWIERVPI